MKTQCRHLRAGVLQALIVLETLGCGPNGERPAPTVKAAERAPSTATEISIATVSDTIPEEHNHRWGLIAAEIYRQAAVLAAREEVGVVARDLAIGEKPGKDAASLQIHFAMDGDNVMGMLRALDAPGTTRDVHRFRLAIKY